MAVTTLYPNGSTCGVSPQKNDHQRAKRERCKGWSDSAARRQTNWLYSVQTDKLDGIGYALTLTVKDCPESAAEFTKLRNAFIERIKRMDAIRIHWQLEWQARGVPHIHGIIYFPDTHENLLLTNKIINHWLELTKHLGTKEISQNIALVKDVLGWKKYLSKHGSRGINNYQRSSKNIPEKWKNLTGRMWGKLLDWPTQEIKVELDEPGYHVYRRLCRSWRIANARTAKERKRIKSAKRMLKCSDRSLSRVRGVSEWIGLEVSLRFLDLIIERGHKVET